MESWEVGGKLERPFLTAGGQLVQIRINCRAKTASEPPEEARWSLIDRGLRPNQLANLSFGLLFSSKRALRPSVRTWIYTYLN